MFISCFDVFVLFGVFFFFKQKTAYEMRISDWSSDVCSSDLAVPNSGLVTARVILLVRRVILTFLERSDEMVETRSMPWANSDAETVTILSFAVGMMRL